MEEHEVSGFSSVSAGEALAAALGDASAMSAGSHNVHVFLVSLTKIGDGWKAVARIVMEPVMENGTAVLEKDMEHEEELKRDLKKEDEYREKIEGVTHLIEAVESKYEAENERDYSHLWLEVEYELTYHQVERPPHFDYVHFVPPQFWDDVQKRIMDADFNLAVHRKEFGNDLKTFAPKRDMGPGVSPRRDKKYVFANGLDENLG